MDHTIEFDVLGSTFVVFQNSTYLFMPNLSTRASENLQHKKNLSFLRPCVLDITNITIFALLQGFTLFKAIIVFTEGRHFVETNMGPGYEKRGLVDVASRA